MRVPRLLRSVAVGALVLAAFEVAARHFGWFDPALVEDPYLGFPGTNPLYREATAADGTAIYKRAENKGSYRDAEFPVAKPEREFRVFCIGGSSVRSEYFMARDGSFPHLLEIYLGALLVDRVPRVINAGGGGAGSIQNLEVMREIMADQPDLVVVYPEGGEKNLVPPLPQGVMARADDASPVRVLARRELTRLRLYQAVRDGYRALMPERRDAGGAASAFSAFALYAVSRPFSPTTFSRPFEFKLDRVPPVMPHPIPAEEISHAHARFLRNLGTMAELAQDDGVPLLFVNPVRNIKASLYLRFHIDPSEIRGGDIDGWRAAYRAGLQAKQAGRFEEAAQKLAAVRSFYVEDHDEILAFDIAECLERLGRYEDAEAEYARPYLDHPMRRLIKQAADEHDVPLVDPFPQLLPIAEHGIPGYDLFTDSFHPMPETNRVIALAVVAAMRERGLGGPMRPDPGYALTGAEGRVRDIIAHSPPPEHNVMLRAILAGDYDAAVAVGRAIPDAALTSTRLTESLYYGWALSKQGDLAGARSLCARLRTAWLHNDAGLPPLDRDEDMVRNAFGGDLFAWF